MTGFVGLSVPFLLETFDHIGQLALFLLGLSQCFFNLFEFRQQSFSFG